MAPRRLTTDRAPTAPTPAPNAPAAPAPGTITERALLDALAEALDGEDAPRDAKTVVELSLESGLSAAKVRAGLKVLQQSGRLMVHFVVRPGIDGRRLPVPAYTIRPARGAPAAHSARRPKRGARSVLPV